MHKLLSKKHIKIEYTNSVKIVFSLLVFLLLSISNLTFSQTEYYAEDIAYHMGQEHIFTLPLTAKQQTFDIPIVKYTARSAMVKGVVVIIGDLRPDGNIDTKLHLLAKNLPDSGWNTLFVMPQPSYIPSNIRENLPSNNANDQAPALDTQKETPQLNIKSKQLQTAKMAYSQEDFVSFIRNLTNQLNATLTKGAGYQIIYAKGQSAFAAIEVLSDPKQSIAHALVIDNPYWPNMESNQLIPAKLAKLPLPVLDIVSLSDNLWAKKTTRTRRITSEVELKPLYRQTEVASHQSLENGYDQLSGELINWTRFMGW